MIKVYGTNLCPDCVACKENFDQYEIDYEFIDITANMPNMKEFMKYRDKEAVFDPVRGKGIGIPACLDEEGNLFLDWQGYLADKGLEVLEVEHRTGQACRLDGSGC